MSSPKSRPAPRPPKSVQLPLSLSSTTLTTLVNENPQLPLINSIKNPLKRGFSPRQVTPATSHHVNSQASMFSLANTEQRSYVGFFNLGILVFITITLRLILENLMKYGLLFKISNFFSSSPQPIDPNLPPQPSIILPFLFWVVYITILTPVFAYLIEVFATRKALFQSTYTPTPSAAIAKNTSIPDIQKRALIGHNLAFWLHVVNIIIVFFSPLIYIFNTKLLPLLLRFPIAFMCVVTTMKMFSYVHTSTSIRTTTGQCIAFDTSLDNNHQDAVASVKNSSNNGNNNNNQDNKNKNNDTNNDSLSTLSTNSLPLSLQIPSSTSSLTPQLSTTDKDGKMIIQKQPNTFEEYTTQQMSHFQPLINTTTNTSSVPLSAINPSTAIVLPHQGKQSILQMQFDVYNSMCLSYLYQVKLLLHTITVRYLSFTPDELWTNIDESKAKESQRMYKSPISRLINFLLYPLYFTFLLFFGHDKKNRIYTIITRGFGLIQTNHTFNYKLAYQGESIHPTLLSPDDELNDSNNMMGNGSSEGNDFSLFGCAGNDDSMFAELFDQDTKTGAISSPSRSGVGVHSRVKSTKVTIHIENHFRQKQTNVLQLSTPELTLGQKIASEHDSNNEIASKKANAGSTTTKDKLNKNGKKNDKNEIDNCAVAPEPVSVTYSKNASNPTHSSVTIQNIPHYPATLPRYSVFDYAPCLSQLFYFLISPTLMYQISYPRSSRIKIHFILRRVIELCSIGVLLLFFIEQFVRPTLMNSLHYFLSLDNANNQIREKLRLELQNHIASLPTMMNTTFSMIESSVNSTLSKIINEDITNKLLENTNVIANSIVDHTATMVTGGVVNASHQIIPHVNNNNNSESIPVIVTSLGAAVSSALGIVERTLKLSLPNVIVWLLIFYGLFHSYLNLVAEISQFGDRSFYLEWWNSRDLGEYWNTWNQPVYQFFGRHIFSSLVSFPFITSTMAKFAVFLISAILHEAIIAVPMQIVAFHAFFGMLFQVPLILITSFLHKKHNNPIIGNVIFWISFVILGQPSLILLYFYQYLHTHNLIPSNVITSAAGAASAAATAAVTAATGQSSP